MPRVTPESSSRRTAPGGASGRSLVRGVALAALTASAGIAAEVRIAGTDLLGVEFSQAVYAWAGRNRLQVALALDGSRPAIEELRTGHADLALLVLPTQEETALAGLDSIVLAYHPLVVLAAKECPIDDVRLEQLAAVFGPGVKSARWGDLGAGGDWADAAVELWIPAVGQGLAAEFFRHAVLGGREFRPAVTRYSQLASLSAALAGSGHALVLASGTPPASGKVLALKHGGLTSSPSPGTLHDGSYPLRLVLRIAVRKGAVGPAKPLLAMLGGDTGAVACERAGWVPLPPPARVQQMLALESR